MDLSSDISIAETLYRDKLELYLGEIFRDVKIDSHGPEHHSRVWRNAKELLSYQQLAARFTGRTDALKILIGVYLHDSGMAIDPGPRHGLHSRSFCEKFLEQNKLERQEFSDLLDAIENHDKKDYKASATGNALLDIINIADDLDAFGYIGIYRYLEIYLIRGTDYRDVGKMIITNVNSRFSNLVSIIDGIPSLVKQISPRVDVIISFFEKYNIRAAGYPFNTGRIEGYCGVAEIIGEMIKTGESLDDVTEKAVESTDRVISLYFGELSKELTL